MKRWSYFFLAAGLFNILGGAVGFFTFEAQFRAQGLPPPTYPFAFQILFLAVVSLGIGYLMVARSPRENRDLVWVGFLTKMAGFTMSLWAIHTGQLPESSWWQPVVVDLSWGVGFAVFLWQTRG